MQELSHLDLASCEFRMDFSPEKITALAAYLRIVVHRHATTLLDLERSQKSQITSDVVQSLLSKFVSRHAAGKVIPEFTQSNLPYYAQSGRNAVLNELKHLYRRNRHVSRYVKEASAKFLGFDRNEVDDILEEFAEIVDEKDRLVTFAVLAGFKKHEIPEHCGMSRYEVSTRLERSSQVLQRLLSEYSQSNATARPPHEHATGPSTGTKKHEHIEPAF